VLRFLVYHRSRWYPSIRNQNLPGISEKGTFKGHFEKGVLKGHFDGGNGRGKLGGITLGN
jgi:hypothetical protein